MYKTIYLQVINIFTYWHGRKFWWTNTLWAGRELKQDTIAYPERHTEKNKNGKENILQKITYTGISQMVFFKTDEWISKSLLSKINNYLKVEETTPSSWLRILTARLEVHFVCTCTVTRVHYLYDNLLHIMEKKHLLFTYYYHIKHFRW